MKILKGSLRETLYCWPCESGESATDCATSSASVHPSAQHTCSHAPSKDGRKLAAPQIKRSTIYTADQVTYMSDQLGLHRVENPSSDEVAISLHLYTVSAGPFLFLLPKTGTPLLMHPQPPNAAKHGCHIFDAATGKRSHVKQCHFYSEFGVQKNGLA